jgi:AAA+ ATPase superfamily predicted ATPase
MITNSIVTITQLPQVGKSSIMRGTIKNATGGTVSGVIRFVSVSSSVLTQSNIERNGKYEVYAPLNVTCTLQVVTDDGLIVFSEMFSRTSTTEFEKDITITGTFDNPVSPISED